MSTSEEIMEVYEGDIQQMTDRVVSRNPLALVEGTDNVQEIYPEGLDELRAAVDRADNTPAPSGA
jgi:hypothetical protein